MKKSNFHRSIFRTNNVEVFDLVEKNWSQIASLNKKRSALTSVSLDGKI